MTNKQILKLVFHKDNLALIASLVFFWFTISILVDSNYEKKNLTSHIGQVVKIDSVITREKDKPLFKEITKELRLTLNNEENYFTITSTRSFGDITSKINIGDTVTIFTKSKLWGIFGIGKSSNISQLAISDNVIIDFEKYQQTLSGLYIMTLIASVGFFIFFYIRTKRRYNLKIANKK